jgi:hypothetical protein
VDNPRGGEVKRCTMISKELRQKVSALTREGRTATYIATTLGITTSDVSFIRKITGVMGRETYRKLFASDQPKNKLRLRSMFDGKMSDRRIADVFNCDRSTIRRQRVIMGYDVPRPSCVKAQPTKRVCQSIQNYKTPIDLPKPKLYADYLKEARAKVPDFFKKTYTTKRHNYSEVIIPL